jgi:splicing factor 1
MFDENVVSMEEEERMERQNLLKGLHPKMRQWYNSVPIAPIKQRYGMFPPFWQDLEKWEHLKLLRKLYLTATEKTESGSIFDIMELLKVFVDATSVNVAVDIVEGSNGENFTTETPSGGNESQAVKKRRNRWGAAPIETASTEVFAEGVTPEIQPISAASSESNIAAEEAAIKKQRRSTRWSAAEVTNVPAFVPIAPLTQEVIQQTMVLKVQLEQIGSRLVTVLQDAVRISLDPSRSPSPPPRYDGTGKRSNTRDVRMKEDLIEQRGKIIEELIQINPHFQPPSDYIRAKPFKRLIIPFREFPTYNFIGLIIGPRGNTQKELELATGCKISIRGKGSSKEGSLGRAGKKNPDDDEELHVHVTADDAAKVEAGAKLIASFLNPIDDEKNDHKQKQLRELVRKSLVFITKIMLEYFIEITFDRIRD